MSNNPLKKIDPFSIPSTNINLVEASAGTGKTYNIASLFVRLILVEKLPVDKILVVTYTEAATKELRDRLMNRLRESIIALTTGRPVNREGKKDEFLESLLVSVTNTEHCIFLLNEAIRNFDEAAIHTIHGFCYRVLQEQAFQSRLLYDSEMVGDDFDAVLELVDDYWRRFVSGVSDDALKQPFLKYLTDNGYDPETLALELSEFVGKPYLNMVPVQVRETLGKKDFDRLSELFGQLKTIWDDDSREICELLNNAPLRHYRSNWLDGWTVKMHDWLLGTTPPIALFDKFEKFAQSTINNSVKKNSNAPSPKHPFFELCDEYMQLTAPYQGFDIQFKKDLLKYIQQEIADKKEQLQILSFDDLLLKLQSALNNPDQGEKLAETLRKTYRVALVDEFQDTDPVQYDIFKKIYTEREEGTGLFMIGDPKQSIYSFRGADIFTYLEARKDADRERIYQLNKNYRSVPRLLDAINVLFGKVKKPFVFENIDFNPVKAGKKDYIRLKEQNSRKPPLQILTFEKSDQKKLKKNRAIDLAVASTVAEIHRLLKGGNKGEITLGENDFEAKDIAVLVRTHKQAQLVADALREKGIKSVQYSQASVYKSKEAEELQRVLQAVAEPSDEAKIKTALSTRLLNHIAHEIYELEENETKWAVILERFSNLHRQWQNHGFAYMFRSLLSEEQIRLKLIRLKHGERALTNTLHLGELLQAHDQEEKNGMRGLVKWLNGKRKEEDKQLEEEQLRLESDEELVKIVTMHRSKGLEYQVVFCPFLWLRSDYRNTTQNLVFHDPEKQHKVFLDLNGEEGNKYETHRWLAEREELAESLRLAYVAMTRAKSRCYVTWIPVSNSDFSPLGYLLLDSEFVLNRLESRYKAGKRPPSLPKESYDQRLKLLAEKNNDCIEIVTVDEEEVTSTEQLDMKFKSVLKCRTFNRKKSLSSRQRISSFSSLTRWDESDVELPDYDQLFEQPDERETPVTERSIFTFPRGPKPGTCIHKIFEELDFSDLSDLTEIVRQNLKNYNIEPSWLDVITNTIKVITSKSLLTRSEIMLAGLQSSEILKEMEFYYTIDKINSAVILSVIRDNSSEEIALRSVETAPGFMKGYIDLIFRREGKFYILDYKTNYLGDTVSDYSHDQLQKEITSSGYDLQYHIYTVALHRYLRKRLPEYSYDRYFGGVFYLFLRGINSETRNKNGIYFDRPVKSAIEELDSYLLKGDRL